MARVEVRFDGVSRGAARAARQTRDELQKTSTTAERESKRFGAAARFMRKHLLAIAVSAGLTAGGVALAFKRSIDAASNLEEQINKARVVFRGAEAQVLEWSKTTANALGISQRAALEYAGTFGNMLVPMGFARREAGAMSTTLVNLAADMASFNNASPEETLEALRAGLAGETEPLRRFGVFLNEARIQAEALEKGLIREGEALTAAGKAASIYSIILKDTGDAQGDVARTANSWANVQRRIGAQIENTAASIGSVFLPIVARAGQAVSEWLGRDSTQRRVRELAEAIRDGLGGAIAWVQDFLRRNGQEIADVFRAGWQAVVVGVKVFAAVASAADRVARALGGWDELLFGIAAAFVALRLRVVLQFRIMQIQAAIAARAIGASFRAALIGTGIGALVVAAGIAAELVVRHWGTIRKAAGRVVDALRDAWGRFWLWLRRTALETALKVVEPFSHLPGKMGGWARRSKEAILVELDALAVEAAKRGRAAGDALGRAMFNAQQTWLRRMAAGRAQYQSAGSAGTGAERATAGLRGLFPAGTDAAVRGGPGAGSHAASDWQSGNAFDVYAQAGTKVLSPVNGRVVKVSGRDPALGTVVVGKKRIYGWGVTISGGSDATTFYLAHLDNVVVRAGQTVKRGQVIGFVAAWKGGDAHVHVAQPWGITPGVGISAAAPSAGGPGGGGDEPAGPDYTVDIGDLDIDAGTPGKAKTKVSKAEAERKRVRKSAEVVREQAAAIAREIARLPENARRQLGPRMQRLRRELATVTTDAGLRRVKAELAKIREAVKAAIDRLEQDVANKRESFGRAFGRLADKALEVFDAKTDELIRQAEAKTDDLDAALAGDTPAEAELRAFRDAREAERRARERAEAEAIEDPLERAARLRELDLEDAERALEQRAQAERRALEDEIALERERRERAAEERRRAIEDERRLLRERFEQRLAELEQAWSNEEISADEAQRRMLALLGEYGIDYANAGALIGRYFAQGFRDALQEVAEAVNELRRAINALRSATGRPPLPGADVSIGGGAGGGGGPGIGGRGGPGGLVEYGSTVLAGDTVLARSVARAVETPAAAAAAVSQPLAGARVYVLGTTEREVARALASLTEPELRRTIKLTVPGP